MATAIYDRSQKYCAENATCGLIGAINSVNSMDCADIKVSDGASDEFIAIPIAIDAGNLTDFAEGAAGGLIAAIDADVSMNCTDKSISDYAAD